MEGLTIGAVARRAGLRPSALRYYEDEGLLPAPARVNGRRRYDTDVFDRLAVIRLAQAAGLTVAEIRTFLHGTQELALQALLALPQRRLQQPAHDGQPLDDRGLHMSFR